MQRFKIQIHWFHFDSVHDVLYHCANRQKFCVPLTVSAAELFSKRKSSIKFGDVRNKQNLTLNPNRARSF